MNSMRNKELRMLISITGLLAAAVYILNFFEVIHHPYIPAIAGVTVIGSYLAGVYFQKRDQKDSK
jgi:hypothetical protein